MSTYHYMKCDDLFQLVDDFWDEKWKSEGVVDVTAKLQSVWH